MSKNALPGAWMAMASIGALAMTGLWWNRINKDMEAFNELVRDKKVSDPMEVWKLCCGYHRKLKTELVESQARIEAGEEIVRVGQGLAEVRKMMDGPELDPLLKLKRAFGQDLSEGEKSAALKKIEKGTVPAEVKRAIIAHWWTELIRLFVPWGLVLPDEIDYVKDPCFRLVDKEVREAILRMEVVKYKEGYESFKAAHGKALERELESSEKLYEERRAWQKEKAQMQQEQAKLQQALDNLERARGTIEVSPEGKTPDA